MKLNQKRGISDVVTTVLMILLVIAAIGILWAVVQRFVTQGTSNISGTSDCLTTSLTITSATNASTLTVKVARSGTNSGNLTSLRFFVDGAVAQMNSATGSPPGIGETTTYTSSAALPTGLVASTVVGKQVTASAVIGSNVCPTASDPVTVTAA